MLSNSYIVFKMYLIRYYTFNTPKNTYFADKTRKKNKCAFLTIIKQLTLKCVINKSSSAFSCT